MRKINLKKNWETRPHQPAKSTPLPSFLRPMPLVISHCWAANTLVKPLVYWHSCDFLLCSWQGASTGKPSSNQLCSQQPCEAKSTAQLLALCSQNHALTEGLIGETLQRCARVNIAGIKWARNRKQKWHLTVTQQGNEWQGLQPQQHPRHKGVWTAELHQVLGQILPLWWGTSREKRGCTDVLVQSKRMKKYDSLFPWQKEQPHRNLVSDL